MPTLLILRHDPKVTLGWLGDVLDERRVPYRLVRLDEGQSLPHGADCDAVVSLGGEMGSCEEDAFPFLAEEKRFLREQVRRDKPVLGVCLGRRC